MDLLSFNVGYFLGFNSQRDWFRRPNRILSAPKATETRNIRSMVELLAELQPDFIALQEVDTGSLRTNFRNQPNQIAQRLANRGVKYEYRADCKYSPDKLISRLPIFRFMSNMICWREGSGRARYVEPGTKELVHLYSQANAPTVIAVHLPTMEETRRKQIQKVAAIANDHEPAVIIGDFNLFNGTSELAPLIDDLNFTLHAPNKTYPTAKPKYKFDIMLTSPGVSVERCEIVNKVDISDHYPLIATVE